MQTIHISVNDNYASKLINMLENLKGIMLEDIKVDKTIDSTDKSTTDFINAQTTVMSTTWDNTSDEAWDEL